MHHVILVLIHSFDLSLGLVNAIKEPLDIRASGQLKFLLLGCRQSAGLFHFIDAHFQSRIEVVANQLPRLPSRPPKSH